MSRNPAPEHLRIKEVLTGRPLVGPRSANIPPRPLPKPPREEMRRIDIRKKRWQECRSCGHHQLNDEVAALIKRAHRAQGKSRGSRAGRPPEAALATPERSR